MYKSFYGLKENPFNVNPDPRYLFMTKEIEEALSGLMYGIRTRKGIITLTGEVGTGKTLLLRSLLGLLQRREVAFALIFNPSLSALEFIRFVAGDLGLPVAGKAKDEILQILNGFLLQRHQKSLTTVLVVDEAHHLSPEVLEEIRLLTNLETAQQKLLQIVMAGQPELDRKLDSFDLRQLKQRIALRCHLEPLNLEECRNYIARRLRVAGAENGSVPFSEPAIVTIFRHSKGFPRLINTVCENALLAGYAKGASVITPEIIEGVAKDLRLGVVAAPADAQTDTQGEEKKLLHAVRALLKAHELLAQDDRKLPSSVENRVSGHEPYI